MDQPPTGTVTLVFTDIEGSTRLLRTLGDRYGEALAEHHRLLREIWANRGGVEISTEGDSFFVVFSRGSDAVAAAADAQRALADHPWPEGQRLRIRIGIHTGEPSLTAEGYVGIDVHRAARIAAAAHGGQIVLSATTRNLLLPDLPDGGTIRGLGTFRLKDLPDPEPLFEVLVPGLEAGSPPLRAQAIRTTNLPNLATPLVGRERELDELMAILRHDQARLLTVTGSGGTGKTRLALQIGLESRSSFEDGVFFVDLSALVDPGLVLPTIAQTLPLGERPGDPIADWLHEHLDERDMLVILDNFEQVMGAAPSVGELVARTRGPTFLVTSREPLRLATERFYALSPLGVPDTTAPARATPIDVEVVGRADSVRLFVQLARAAQPGFELDMKNAATVAEICARLDGLPLALELAAPWLRVIRPEDLLAQLETRLEVLGAGRRDAPERQQTLRGAIDWSYRLLDPHEQELFERLGVFAGRWSLDAAAALGPPEASAATVLLTIGSLVEKSLVRRETGPGGLRFSMLESIRAFALERLHLTGGFEAAAERHAAFYVTLAERAEPHLFGPDQSEWLDLLASDLDNIRAALVWASGRPERGAVGVRIVGALALFWFWTALNREGYERSRELASTARAVPATVRAKALWSAGFLASLLGEGDAAQDLLQEALALARDVGDRSLVARSLDMLGLQACFADDPLAARGLLEESVSEARAAGDGWCLADALGTLGSILPLQGEFEMAEAISREAFEIADEADDDQGRRMALFGVALTASRRGDHAATRDAAEEGLTISRAIGDTWFCSYFLWLLAIIAAERGEHERARQQAAEALELARELQAPLLVVCALEAVATAARSEDDAVGARAALEEAREVGRGGGVPGSYVASVVRMLGELALEAGDGEMAAALLAEAAGSAGIAGDIWGVARSIAARGRAAAREDRRIDARRMFARSLSMSLDLTAWSTAAEALEAYAASCEADEARLTANLLGAADQLRCGLDAERPPWFSTQERRARELALSVLGERVFEREQERDWRTTADDIIRRHGTDMEGHAS